MACYIRERKRGLSELFFTVSSLELAIIAKNQFKEFPARLFNKSHLFLFPSKELAIKHFQISNSSKKKNTSHVLKFLMTDDCIEKYKSEDGNIMIAKDALAGFNTSIFGLLEKTCDI